MIPELPIDSIQIDQRHRRDLGDITSLAESIDNLGLIHPVVVTPDHQLVAGERRLAAARELGWEVIPVTVIHSLGDYASLLEAERDENTCRKDFTPSEAAAVRKAIAEALAPEAEKRKAQAPGKPRGAKVSGSKLERQKTRNAAAKGTGYSATTLDKVDEVIELADDPKAPESVRDVAREAISEMDDTGNVTAAHRKVMDELVGNDADVQRAKYRQAFSRTCGQYIAVLQYEPEHVAAVLEPDEWADIEREIDAVNKWWDNVKSHRGPKLVAAK